MLKMLVLKMLKKSNTKQKQCIPITYYKFKLSLFGRDDTKGAESLILIVVAQAEQGPKVQQKAKTKKN